MEETGLNEGSRNPLYKLNYYKFRGNFACNNTLFYLLDYKIFKTSETETILAKTFKWS